MRFSLSLLHFSFFVHDLLGFFTLFSAPHQRSCPLEPASSRRVHCCGPFTVVVRSPSWSLVVAVLRCRDPLPSRSLRRRSPLPLQSFAIALPGLTYSVAQGLIAELKSREEYEACNVRNPIKVYTEGLHTIPLESEGMRYFVSSEPENCKNGLKLHVEVLPKADERITESSTSTLTDEAVAPTTSGSAHYGHNTMLMLTVILFLIIGLAY